MKKLLLITVFFFIFVEWSNLSLKLLLGYNAEIYYATNTVWPSRFGLPATPFIMIPAVLVINTLEEFFFRFGPIAKSMEKGRSLLRTCLISSAAFAIAHISGNFIWQSLIIHLGDGLLFCLLYILAAGKERKHGTAFATTLIVHFSINMFVILFIH